MENEKQLIISSKIKQLRKNQDKIEIMKLIKKNYNYQNKKLYFFISIIILIFIIIIYLIYDNKEEFKSQSNFLNENIMNLKNKINMIETKLNNLNQNRNIEINNISLSSEDLPLISFEKFDENIYQELKKQQMEFCNEQTK